MLLGFVASAVLAVLAVITLENDNYFGCRSVGSCCSAEKHMDRNCSAQPIASSDEKTPAVDMSTTCDCETPMTAHPTNDMITHGHRALGSKALRKKESPKAATIGVRLLIAAARIGSRRGRSRVRVSVFISSTSNVLLAQVSAAFKPVCLCSRRL